MQIQMVFNPFKKTSVIELESIDLASLADIPEGWFIEYKREPCKAKDYAKEVSSFANSKGGWIFVGLEENPTTKKPLGGPGLEISEASKFQNTARDAIIQNLSPSPYFEIQIVCGPIPALSITEGKCVLVIYIPESQNTPHIHCSGKIYSRKADSSRPVEVNDRSELDTLYKKAEKLKNFIDEELELGFDESWMEYKEVPWLYYALVPDPALSFSPHDIDLEGFRELLSNGKKSTDRPWMNLPDIYTSSLGFVARNHREQHMLDGAAVTLEYTYDGAIFLSIPLSTGTASELGKGIEFLRKPSGKQFITLLQQNNLGDIRVVDCSPISICLVALHTHINRLLSKVGSCSRYFARIRIVNVFRSVPFINSKTYIDSLMRSIPIIHRKEILIPWRKKRWIEVGDISNLSDFLFFLAPMLSSIGFGDDLKNIVSQSIDTFDYLKPTEKVKNVGNS